MRKSIVEPDRQQMTIWRIRAARRIPQSTNKHSEYVTFIAFPLQQRLHERNSLLRHSTLSCWVIFSYLRKCSGVPVTGMGGLNWVPFGYQNITTTTGSCELFH